MRFEAQLHQGRFLRRYKRFFVDVVLDDGRVVTAHCPNTGRLTGCLVEGAPVLLEPASSPTRKLAWTWKMIRLGRRWVGVDTSIANRLVEEALVAGRIPALAGYARVHREVPYGPAGRSRVDLVLSRGGRASPVAGRLGFIGDERVHVEVKNTTLVLPDRAGRVAAFPDAVTARGTKHLEDLSAVVGAGGRAAMVFCTQRSDCTRFAPADEVDPVYGGALRDAIRAGVEAYALGARIGPRQITLTRALPIDL